MRIIPDPIAEFDDKVEVRNYRRNNAWESGVLVEAEYSCKRSPHFKWRYRVQLDRKSPMVNLLFLTVNDKNIRKAK